MLTDKAQGNGLIVLRDLTFSEPKTKNVIELLKNLQIEVGSSVLLVTRETEGNLVKSARNVPKVRTLTAPLLNVLDLLSYGKLVMTVEAVRKAEEIWSGPLVRIKRKLKAKT